MGQFLILTFNNIYHNIISLSTFFYKKNDENDYLISSFHKHCYVKKEKDAKNWDRHSQTSLYCADCYTSFPDNTSGNVSPTGDLLSIAQAESYELSSPHRKVCCVTLHHARK